MAALLHRIAFIFIAAAAALLVAICVDFGHDRWWSSRWQSLFASAFPLTSIQPRSSSTDALSLAFKTSTSNHYHSLSAAISYDVALSATSSNQPEGITSVTSNNSNPPPPSGEKSIRLSVWLVSISAFIIANSRGPWPAFLVTALNFSQWSFLHAISSMLFGGTIILSALIEYIVITARKTLVIKFWFLGVPERLDVNLVLPALAGAIVSGVTQTNILYGGLASAPKHVVGALHLLCTFGLWWGITDVTTQRKTSQMIRH